MSKFPVLPAAQQLSNNLSPILARFFPHQQNVSSRPPFDPSSDQKMASLQVMERELFVLLLISQITFVCKAFSCFTAYGKWLIGKLIIHLDSDSSICSAKQLKESFLLTVTSGNRAFVFAWLDTQHMSVYLEQEFEKRAQL